jgi:hypothetical protein
LNITSNRLDDDEEEEEGTIIAIDSTGIKVTSRGQWMQEKWQIKKKKGDLKIHIAIDINTKEIFLL